MCEYVFNVLIKEKRVYFSLKIVVNVFQWLNKKSKLKLMDNYLKTFSVILTLIFTQIS